MKRLILKFLIPLLIAASFAVPAFADTAALSEERVKELALEAILENPEIIELAIQRLQQVQQERQQAAVMATLEARRSDLEQDPNAPVLGNPDGDITMVEFFDYNCPYCKRAKPIVEALLKADPNIRVVFREWPVLGEGSVYAARAALAARQQDKYEEFHWALMGFRGRAEEASVLEIAKDVGLDIDKLQADMQADEVNGHIRLSMQLAEGLNINGTPSFVIGDTVLPGLPTLEQLSAAVDEARAAGG
ncbi:Thiol:disulfide interchange protein DsbA precursor [Roseibium album]|nr:Thiol:disulfide interchange protein DsbA precursor [Roseibium album]